MSDKITRIMSQTNNTKISSPPNNEMSIRDLILKIGAGWQYLLSKWIIILIAGIIGAGLGLTYACLKKPRYKAELSFALENESSSGGIGSALGLASQFGIDLGGTSSGGAFSGDNLPELMKSRSMVESALLTTVDIGGKKQTLAELYITFNNFRRNWKDDPKLRNIQFLPGADRSKFTLQQDSVLGEFYKILAKSDLKVDKVDKKLSIITVTVNSKDELFSKYFTEILVKTVSDFYVATKTKKSVQNVNILQRQTDSVRRELNAAIMGVASSFDTNPNANPNLQMLRVPSQRRQVDVQANQAILTQLVTNLELSKMSLRKETPLIQLIDMPILPLEKSRLGKIAGVIIGGLISTLIVMFILLLRKSLKNIIAENN